MDVSLFVFVSLAMFTIGIIGVLINRNALIFFLSIELLLNAGNLLFVTFAREWENQTGLIWVFFVLIIAAAEAAVGIAIFINQFRTKQVVDVDQYDVLRG